MEEKIEQIIRQKVKTQRGMYLGGEQAGEIYTSRILAGIPEAAAEIAKQIEAIELTWADKVEELTDTWHEKLAEKEAQLAEMREILQRADEFIINRKPEKGGGAIVGAIRKVLAAVPEVKSGRED